MALTEKHVTPARSRLDRTLVKWAALYLPLKWPVGIETRPEIDQRCEGTSPGEFAGDVAQLTVLLERVATRSRDAEWPEHPTFGRMSHRSWMRWAYLHADHHLRQFGA